MDSVRDIVQTWLVANKYDGLYSPHLDCACETSDLFPCEAEGVDRCRPGVKVECTPDDCELDGSCNWHIASPERVE